LRQGAAQIQDSMYHCTAHAGLVLNLLIHSPLSSCNLAYGACRWERGGCYVIRSRRKGLALPGWRVATTEMAMAMMFIEEVSSAEHVHCSTFVMLYLFMCCRVLTLRTFIADCHQRARAKAVATTAAITDVLQNPQACSASGLVKIGAIHFCVCLS
jgi:hypothetical protein